MHMSKLCIPACAHNIPTIINQWEEVWDQPATGTWTRLFWNCLCWPLPLQWHAMCCALASSDCFPGSQVRTAACPTGFETPRPFSTPTLRWIWGEAAWQRARWTATGPRFDWGTIPGTCHAMLQNPLKGSFESFGFIWIVLFFSWIVCLKQTCFQAESLLSLNTSNYPQNLHYTYIYKYSFYDLWHCQTEKSVNMLWQADILH